MTISEFKIWLQGFEEHFDAPNEAQWKRIREQIERIEVPIRTLLPYATGGNYDYGTGGNYHYGVRWYLPDTQARMTGAGQPRCK